MKTVPNVKTLVGLLVGANVGLLEGPAGVVGLRVVGLTVVGFTVVGLRVVGLEVVGLALGDTKTVGLKVGFPVVGLAVVGFVVGAFVATSGSVFNVYQRKKQN